MILLWLPIGLAIPTLIGWLILTLLEGKTPVLLGIERWVMGLLLGLTLTMYLTFLGHIASLAALSLGGFFSVQLVALAILGGLYLLRRWHLPGIPASPVASPSPRPRTWILIALIALLVWTAVKIAVPGFILMTTPPYFDDTITNWNLRGDVFFVTKNLELRLPTQHPNDLSINSLSSYPPTVPMVKAWLAHLAGRWDSGLVDSVHLVWLLISLALVWTTIRHTASRTWSVIALWLLASLPLYLMQGTNAYADVFLSAHLLAAAILLYHAARAETPQRRLAALRLAAFATALLPFTKNEGLLIYLPTILAVTGGLLLVSVTRKTLTWRQVGIGVAWFVLLILAIGAPWIVFKLAHGMPFGNAKSVSGFTVAWQSNVLFSIAINTFFEGNWLLLFPVFIALLLTRSREAFRTPLAMFTFIFLIVSVGQLPLFLFTGLSTEALMQTGYARGLIHLVPIVVILVTLLVRSLVENEDERCKMQDTRTKE
ncbi:hypothetical protein HY285_00705 [Candidatus Peregrinibacteria bacterium]|nr:hypothetical protein [Candidatus Peregrinibacteria bacterium]MBI3816050.1 hypothetical protein [Candidatus Peregrinibacteria bacterium]